jgi:two-component system, response regulator
MAMQSILLVEDNRDDAELLFQALRAAGVGNDLKLATDGYEALDFVFARGVYADRDDNSLPSAVLLDFTLPTVDAVDVLKVLRANERTRMLPVVVLTSSKAQQDLLASCQFCAYSYIEKPVTFLSFAAAAHQLGLLWFLGEAPRSKQC